MASPGKKRRRGIQRVVVTNTLIALLGPMLYLLFSRPVTMAGLRWTALLSFIHANVIGSLASFAMNVSWAWLGGLRPAWRWSSVAAILLAAAVVGSLLSVGAITALGLSSSARYWKMFGGTLKVAVMITLACGGGAALFATTRARLEETNLQLRTKELERERALQLATEARLASLESRVHPHFLFNALNAISALIRTDPARAERLVGRLAAILHYSLHGSHLGLVKLGQEMQVVAGYVEIETARFGERLQCAIDVPAVLEVLEVPPLSVQTLVENSVKHAVLPRREGGRILVKARSVDGRLQVTVWDDGPGFDAEVVQPGHGLHNLQARLAGLFDTRGTLAFTRRDGGMEVAIELPVAQKG